MKKQPSDVVASEMHLFNFRCGRQFGIFRNGQFVCTGSWWTLRVCFDKGGDIIDCRFWRNCMEPGDVRLTGEKLRQAVQNWMTFTESPFAT